MSTIRHRLAEHVKKLRAAHEVLDRATVDRYESVNRDDVDRAAQLLQDVITSLDAMSDAKKLCSASGGARQSCQRVATHIYRVRHGDVTKEFARCEQHPYPFAIAVRAAPK